jgi:hypothetical protein
VPLERVPKVLLEVVVPVLLEIVDTAAASSGPGIVTIAPARQARVRIQSPIWPLELSVIERGYFKESRQAHGAATDDKTRG